MTYPCQNCKAEVESALAPCPDGLVGCMTAHYDEKSYLCPKCGHDNAAWVRSKLAEGVRLEIGVGVGNVASIAKLDLYTDKGDLK